MVLKAGADEDEQTREQTQRSCGTPKTTATSVNALQVDEKINEFKDKVEMKARNGDLVMILKANNCHWFKTHAMPGSWVIIQCGEGLTGSASCSFSDFRHLNLTTL